MGNYQACDWIDCTQIREVFTQCRLNSNNRGDVSRRQSDDDTDDSDDKRSGIPLLPDVVRNAAMALGGGPFEYEGLLSYKYYDLKINKGNQSILPN